MANYNNLLNTINGAIKTNGTGAITGQLLQTILDGMVASLGAKYQYAGVATPSTNPGTPDENVFYLATQAGTYTNFGGLVVNDGEVCALKWDGTWVKEVTGAATAEQVSQLGQIVTDNIVGVAAGYNGWYAAVPNDGIQAGVRGDTGEIGANSTRLTFSIPIVLNTTAKITAKTGYKIYYYEFDVLYENIQIGQTLDFSHLVSKSTAWATGTTNITLGASSKSFVIVFANTSDTEIGLSELLPNVAIEFSTGAEVNGFEKVQNAIGNKFQIYGPNNTYVRIEQTKTAGGSIFIYDTRWAIRCVSPALTYGSNSELATALGISLVTSPKGVANCIEIQTTKTLCYSCSDGALHIKQRENLLFNDLPLIACVEGWVVRLGFGLESSVLIQRIDDIESSVSTKIDRLSMGVNKLQVYNPVGADSLVIEETNQSGGSLYLHSTRWVTRVVTPARTYNDNSELASALGVSLVISPAGIANCIEIQDTYTLCYSTTAFNLVIKQRDTITNEIPLIACAGGKVIQLGTGMESAVILPRVKSLELSVSTLQTKVGELSKLVVTSQKGNDYLELFQAASAKVETFIFFSDPHYYPNYNGQIMDGAEEYIKTFKKYFNNLPLNFVLSGGDWLSAHNQITAIQCLGEIDGYMNKQFNMLYYPVLGNHDSNYQGELTGNTDTDENDGALSNQQLVNLWFRKWGKLYYSFLGTSTRFYVFDSGIDWVTAMDSYKWEQVDWFANQLLSNTDDNIILVTHIAELNYQDPSAFGNNITPITDNILLIAEAFNARNSITLNGQTYDFSSKTGKVKCLLCGHLHFDANAIVHNIPVIAITWAHNGDFDLVLIDYANNKYKSIRVGTGENKDINLA